MTNDDSYIEPPHNDFSDAAWFDAPAREVVFEIDGYLDDVDPAEVNRLPELDSYLAAGIPWELAANQASGVEPDEVIANITKVVAALYDFAENEDANEPGAEIGVPHGIAAATTLGREVSGPVVAWFRRALSRRNGTGRLDSATVDIALRLGDLLAASGNIPEALSTYREILERLKDDGQGLPADRKVAERVEAVISRADLDAVQPIVTELAALLPTPIGLADPEATRHVYDEMLTKAKADAANIRPFAEGLRRLRLVTTQPLQIETAVDLDETAMQSGTAALVRLTELGQVSDPERSTFGALIDAVMDTEVLAALIFPVHRGGKYRVRFLDCCVLRSSLDSSATYDDHVAAVLGTELQSRRGVALKDVVSVTGSFPEESGVLIAKWRERYGLTERDVFINCPRLLRTRAGKPGHSAKRGVGGVDSRMASAVVTSLGWGGAADVGALLADAWEWGFGTAVDSQRLQAFGDWIDDPRWSRMHTGAAKDLLATINLLKAVPHLPKRVCVLDEPRAAAEALAGQSWLGTRDQPVPIVMIEMNEHRMRWVARHMVTSGGRFERSDAEFTERFEELRTVQMDLKATVQALDSADTPVVVRHMDDHLEDGYAEQVGNDPVDEDFDCFKTTAHKVLMDLEGLVQAHSTRKAVGG
jgi:hypothetical protein